MHVRHVETFAEQLRIAQNFYLAQSKIFHEPFTRLTRRFAVHVRRYDSRIVKSGGYLLRVLDIDAVADS